MSGDESGGLATVRGDVGGVALMFSVGGGMLITSA